MKKGFKPISRLFLHYVRGRIFNTLNSIRFDFDDELKSLYPYCHQESYLGPHPLGRKYPIYLWYDPCVQTVYLVLATSFIVLFGMNIK